MARIVDLNVTRYQWVEGDSGVANVLAPKATELNAGLKISRFVVTTTAIMPAASETVNERSITDTANVVVPTIGNYEGSLVLFRDFTNGAPSDDDLLDVFRSGTPGFMVRRVGKPAASAIAVGDVVDVFKFLTDSPQVMGGTGEGYLKLTVPLLQQGQFAVGVPVGT